MIFSSVRNQKPVASVKQKKLEEPEEPEVFGNTCRAQRSELKETSQFIGWSVMKENQLNLMMFPLRAGCTMTGLRGMIKSQPSL